MRKLIENAAYSAVLMIPVYAIAQGSVFITEWSEAARFWCAGLIIAMALVNRFIQWHDQPPPLIHPSPTTRGLSPF